MRIRGPTTTTHRIQIAKATPTTITKRFRVLSTSVRLHLNLSEPAVGAGPPARRWGRGTPRPPRGEGIEHESHPRRDHLRITPPGGTTRLFQSFASPSAA